MAKQKRKVSAAKQAKIDAENLAAHEARVAWSRQYRRDQKVGRGCNIAFYVLVVVIALIIAIGLVRESEKPDTPQEKLQKQLEEGQRNVCDKWGELVEGC